jgi:hypothetical protein
MTTTYMRAEFPAPDLDDTNPCGVCDGKGVTGETRHHARRQRPVDHL